MGNLSEIRIALRIVALAGLGAGVVQLGSAGLKGADIVKADAEKISISQGTLTEQAALSERISNDSKDAQGALVPGIIFLAAGVGSLTVSGVINPRRRSSGNWR